VAIRKRVINKHLRAQPTARFVRLALMEGRLEVRSLSARCVVEAHQVAEKKAAGWRSYLVLVLAGAAESFDTRAEVVNRGQTRLKLNARQIRHCIFGSRNANSCHNIITWREGEVSRAQCLTFDVL